MSGRKKQIGIEQEKVDLIKDFLVEKNADEKLLKIFDELSLVNAELFKALERQSRLRTLYLKAIKKISSSERSSNPKPDPSKKDNSEKTASLKKTSARLTKDAENASRKAFILRCYANWLRIQAKNAKQDEEKIDEILPSVSPNSKKSPPEQPKEESTVNKDFYDITQNHEDVDKNPGRFLALAHLTKLKRFSECGDFEILDDDLFPEDFSYASEEGLAIAEFMEKANGNVQRLVQDTLYKKNEGKAFKPFPKATLFHSRPGFANATSKPFEISGERKPGYRQSFEETHRWDISIKITDVTLKREILYNPETGDRQIAEQNLGPKHFQMTWNTITTLVILNVEYQLPLNRVAGLMSTPEKSFSRSHLWDLLCYVAEACVKPWLAMIKMLAINTYLIYEDDSETRTRRMKISADTDNTSNSESNPQEETIEDEQPATADQQPKTTDKQTETTDKQNDSKKEKKRLKRFGKETMDEIHKVLRREAVRADGKGKTRAFTSLLAGQAKVRDERTWVVFYYTHFGSCGDVLEDLLKIRSQHGKIPDKPAPDGRIAIEIVCDASSANKPKNDYGFPLTFLGCAMHARRKFIDIPPEDHTSEITFILLCFSYLYALENCISTLGRTVNRTIRMRIRWAYVIWDTIVGQCEKILENEPPNSMAASAARYVLDNAQELRNYIVSVEAMPDNGISERFLRPVRLSENASHGLETERGRLVQDILRSMIATCHAIGVSFEEYLPWLLKKSEQPPDIRLSPIKLTPHAFLQHQNSLRGSQPRG